uniref:Uncharacterized protein n=1 Tax=Arundo donax TaxID=35708 RepID=A0A0A9E8T3_ARUDO
MSTHHLLTEIMHTMVQGLHSQNKRVCITVHGVTLLLKGGGISLRKISMMDLGVCPLGHLQEAEQLILHGRWKTTDMKRFQGGMHLGRLTVLPNILILTLSFLTETGLEMLLGCLVALMEAPVHSKEIGCFRVLRLMNFLLLLDPATPCGSHMFPHPQL